MEPTVGTLAGAVVHLAVIALAGFIVGLVARLLIPGPDPAGMLLTIEIGVAGSLLGSRIGGALGWESAGEFALSVIGAAVLVGLLRLVRGRSG